MEIPTRQTQHWPGSIPFLDVGRLRVEYEGTSVRIDERLTLAALDFLASVVAARPAALFGPVRPRGGGRHQGEGQRLLPQGDELRTHEDKRTIAGPILDTARDQSLLKARGCQRTASTHVLAVVRDLNRVELLAETSRAALNAIATAAPAWLRALAPPEWQKPETKVSELCAELGVTRQTLYRHVDPKGEFRPDALKILGIAPK